MFVGGKYQSFIIGKGEGITGGVSARWNGGAVCRDKKGRIFIAGGFYIILNLEVGRTLLSLSVSNDLWAKEVIGDRK
jgi:hypothetical protein